MYTIGDLLLELADKDPDTPLYMDRTTPEVQRMGLFNLSIVKFVGVVDVPGIKAGEPETSVCLFSARDFQEAMPTTLPPYLSN